MFVNISGDADLARLGEGLHAGCNVDAVPVKIVFVDDNVAKADADSQKNVVLVVQQSVASTEVFLYVQGSLHGIQGAAEFDQCPVTRIFEYPPAMTFDDGIKHLCTQRLQAGEGPVLIDRHHARITDHIGHQNRCEAALHSLFDHFPALF